MPDDYNSALGIITTGLAVRTPGIVSSSGIVLSAAIRFHLCPPSSELSAFGGFSFMQSQREEYTHYCQTLFTVDDDFD
ncbi:hypothetical protein BaRGS_00023625 [Batillaria attramentaria]|uniref:Uncharacterized protein n=1 Tax=Batillaria attramentaria TaxID=370345 RepID=A0ABD0KDA0_9CAEN